MKTAAILLSFLIPICGYGQISRELESINADSLDQLLPELEGTEKIDALNKIAFKLCYKFPDRCLTMASQTIRQSQSLNYKKGEATGYFNLGNGYFFMDSLKNSVVNYLTALRIFENIDVCIEMGYTLDILSLLNFRAGKLKKAIQQIKREIQIAHELSEYHCEALALNSASLYFTNSNKFDSANICLDKALEILRKYPDTTYLASVYHNKAYNTGRKIRLAYLNSEKNEELILDHYKKAIYWLLKAVDLEKTYKFKSKNEYAGYLSIYHNLTYNYLNLRTHDDTLSALKYLHKVKSMTDTFLINNFMKLHVTNRLGDLETGTGDYRAAIKTYKEGIKKAEEARLNFNIKEYDGIDPFNTIIKNEYYYIQVLGWVYRKIYLAYRALGDYKNAHEYYILWQDSKDSLFLEDNRKMITMLEAESENEKTENQIAMLEREKHFNELKAQQTRNVNIGIIIVFAVLLMMGALFLRQNKLKNDHKNALLEQKLLRLQMNPHFIFNALSNIHSLMSPESVNKASAYLVNFSRLLRSSLESSREDYILLEDEISSLENYLELQQLRYQSKFEYEIEVDPDIDLESAILPPMLIQPFIENAIEHGIMHKKGPGKVFIRFARNGNKITCEIEDDGIGREKAWEVEYAKKGKHKSLATEIIRDRIAVLNKKLKQKIQLSISDLKSDDDESPGTRVRLDLPYMLD